VRERKRDRERERERRQEVDDDDASAALRATVILYKLGEIVVVTISPLDDADNTTPLQTTLL
jgi:hypothetical protein